MTNALCSGYDPGVKSVNWPLSMLASIAIVTIGVVAILDKDVTAVSGVILTLLIALGLVELKGIKEATNGNQDKLMEQNKALMAEMAEYRRSAARITDRALEAAPMAPKEPLPDMKGPI